MPDDSPARGPVDKTKDPVIDADPKCNYAAPSGFCLKVQGYCQCDGTDGKVGCPDWAMISATWQLNISVMDLREALLDIERNKGA